MGVVGIMGGGYVGASANDILRKTEEDILMKGSNFHGFFIPSMGPVMHKK